MISSRDMEWCAECTQELDVDMATHTCPHQGTGVCRIRKEKGLTTEQTISVIDDQVLKYNRLDKVTRNALENASRILKAQKDDLRVMFNRCRALTGGQVCDLCTMREQCETTRTLGKERKQ